MKQHFSLHLATRNNALKLADALSTEQLNRIPTGFNNNIIWNLAHIVITQQLLIYKLSANELRIEKSLVDKYRKGSKPEGDLSTKEIQDIKEMLLSSSKQCEKDYQSGLFSKFSSYPTSYGFQLDSIEDAIIFNNAHEAMHLGNMLSMRKLV